MPFPRRRTRPTRVLMLLQNQPYPQDPRVRPEAETLASAGYQVTVVAPRAGGQARSEIVDGVRVVRFPQIEGRGGALGYVLEHVSSTLALVAVSLRVLVTAGFDVVHAHNPPDTILPALAPLKLLGTRFVFDQHDLSPELYCARFDRPPRGLVYSVLKLLERLSFFFADRVVVANESHAAVAMRRGRVDARRVTVVRNGPSAEWLEAQSDDQANGTRTVAYAGVMGRQDGVDVLIRAFARLHRGDARLLVFGDGDARREAEALANQLGVGERVDFHGRVDRKKLIEGLSSADVCVEPAPYSEYNDRSTMVKVMEYMALRKPVVAFDLRENRATGGDALVYVPRDDEASLAAAVDALLDDPPRRIVLGELGRARVETRLAWRHSAPHLLQAYAGLFDDDQVPAPEAAA